MLWGPIAVGGTYFIDGIAADGANVYSINFDGLLIALDQTTGAEVWRRQLSQYAFTSPPTVVDGVVYVGERVRGHGVRGQRDDGDGALVVVGGQRRPQLTGRDR